MNKPALINALGLNANATDTEVEMAVQSAAAGAANYTRLKNELEADRLKVQTERAENLVNTAIAQKKIGAGQKDAFVKMAVGDFDTAKAVLDSLTGVKMATDAVVPDPEVETPSNATGTGAEGDRSKWTLKDYQEKDATALEMMAEKEPAKYSALLNVAYPNLKNHLKK